MGWVGHGRLDKPTNPLAPPYMRAYPFVKTRDGTRLIHELVSPRPPPSRDAAQTNPPGRRTYNPAVRYGGSETCVHQPDEDDGGDFFAPPTNRQALMVGWKNGSRAVLVDLAQAASRQGPRPSTLRLGRFVRAWCPGERDARGGFLASARPATDQTRRQGHRIGISLADWHRNRKRALHQQRYWRRHLGFPNRVSLFRLGKHRWRFGK
jgi:hypothetical protein